MRCWWAAIGAGLLLMGCVASSDADTLQRAATVETSTTTSTTTPPTTTAPAPSTPSTTAVPDPQPVPLQPTPLAASPAELAHRVIAAEQLVRDPATAPDRVAAAAFELQLLYRQLGREPGWDPEVLATTPPELQLTVRNNAEARRQFRSMHTKLSDTLPAWHIVDPAPADELLADFHEAEATFGVPWSVLAAVNLVETGMGRIRGTSIAGAQGPMQFMPSTWDAFGEGDINDPHDAIMGAARYLAHNGGGSGNVAGALWNYNHSDQYVQGVQLYAAIMAENPRAFYGFYNWQVIYVSTAGDIWLPTGFEQVDRIAVADYLATNPAQHLGTATS